MSIADFETEMEHRRQAAENDDDDEVDGPDEVVAPKRRKSVRLMKKIEPEPAPDPVQEVKPSDDDFFSPLTSADALATVESNNETSKQFKAARRRHSVMPAKRGDRKPANQMTEMTANGPDAEPATTRPQRTRSGRSRANPKCVGQCLLCNG